MFFRKKDKTPKNYRIDELNFLSDEAKEAFRILEITETSQLIGKESDNFYLDYCVESGDVADKVILYEMRTAVYFANTPKPDEKKLRWWYWKDNNTENEDIIGNDNI